MPPEVIIGFLALILGIILMTISSDKAVEHSIVIASLFQVSPLMIGLILVSLGTNLPEIVNSIISSSLGHGNINAGDSIGSVLTQITLVLGLLPLLGGVFRVKKREVIVLGACQVLALIMVASIVEKGYISRLNALFLVGSWPIYILISHFAIRKPLRKEIDVILTKRSRLYHIGLASAGFVGVAVGAYMVVQSVILLSEVFKISEYIISFFLVAIGTSLPELTVDLVAIRKKQYELAIGDAIGSCIMDASFSIGIGQVFFPQAVSGELAEITTLYTIFASIAVVATLAVRGKLDKRAGVIFLAIYALSYVIAFI